MPYHAKIRALALDKDFEPVPLEHREEIKEELIKLGYVVFHEKEDRLYIQASKEGSTNNATLEEFTDNVKGTAAKLAEKYPQSNARLVGHVPPPVIRFP